jgi:hypothetical protein
MRRKVIAYVVTSCVFAAVALAGASHASNCDPYADPVYQGNANKGGGAQASICSPYADPVHHENAQKGGGEGNGETKSTPENDYTESYKKDAGGNPDNNKGYSQPDTVAPATQQETEPVVNTDQNKMNYDDNKKAVDSFGVGDEVVGADSSWELPD